MTTNDRHITDTLLVKESRVDGDGLELRPFISIAPEQAWAAFSNSLMKYEAVLTRASTSTDPGDVADRDVVVHALELVQAMRTAHMPELDEALTEGGL
jgi:hypothetical protein